MTTKLKTMDECIEDGIRLLDEKRPGWVEKIDLSKFQIKSECGCVVGQVDGDYMAGIRALGIWDPDDMDRDAEFGFDIAVDPLGVGLEPTSYSALQEAWVRRLIQLKAERGIA